MPVTTHGTPMPAPPPAGAGTSGEHPATPDPASGATARVRRGHSGAPARTPARGRRPLAGLGTLLRLMLRRDRIRLTVWVLGAGLLGFYFAHAIQTIAEDEEQLRSLAGLYADPIGRMMVGPGFGMDAPTHARFYAAGYALFLYILVALMSIFTVVRHTRAEEQTGRAELLRAGPVGRHATLAAALLLVTAANLGAAALIAAGALTAGYETEGSLLVAATSAAVGLLFAGAASVTAQLSESSRRASAMAGGLLGLAYLIRMGGDSAEVGGSALSWASPLGWSQQTAPYVDDLWWPLALLGGGAVLLALLGFLLSTRRDVGASLLPARLGRAEARPVLGTPLGLAARTLAGGLRGWGIALVLAALMFGAYAQSMVDAADSLPEEMAQIFAGEDLMRGYLAYIALFMGVFVAAAGVGALQQMRGEEVRGRAEYGLSVPVSRTTWLGAHLTVIAGGLLLILALVGAAMGVGAGLSLEVDGWSHFRDLFLAGLLQAPAVLAAVGIVAALLGWLPRLAGAVGWVLVGFGGVMSTFGSLLDLPEAAQDLNLFGHLAEYPVEEVEWAPVLWLLAIAALGMLLGILGWHRREVGRV
ncbi:hypothetical protein [Brevibacterium salitolerans]|uniref:Exporter of polyketide antibiotics n=1 Tax=Brevibacterium salitolerans TaxID=1403566 RepID=A0ABP5IA31_9MICO